MHIALIWAMAENRVIGRANDLPWQLPKEMRHFIRTTRGKPVIMGRKTFVSMPQALPGRMNIVITRDPDWQAEKAYVVHDFDAAVALASARSEADGHDEVMITGGADIYAMALPHATRLYMTTVHANPAGDVFFPEFDMAEWRCLSEERFEPDADNAEAFTIATYERA